jgi:isopentenyl diphosphate isomerase/L-lactate dehydrogenase-like FMN-dependent dehydrogenase
MTTEILGAKYDSPIVIAPTSSNRAFHPDGEVAVARAARTGNHLQMLSTVATTSIEDAIAARGAPVWFQLYPTRKWEVAEALVRRAERAGSPVIVVTVACAGELGKRWFGCGALIRGSAMGATTERFRTMSHANRISTALM